jgi:hypothetical protein
LGSRGTLRSGTSGGIRGSRRCDRVSERVPQLHHDRRRLLDRPAEVVVAQHSHGMSQHDVYKDGAEAAEK